MSSSHILNKNLLKWNKEQIKILKIIKKETSFEKIKKLFENISKQEITIIGEPIIDNGLLLDGTILLIVGPPKSKKTFFTQNMALSIAAGSEFAGFSIPKPRKVLYNIAEGGYFPNRERLKTMAKSLNEHSYDNFMMSNFGYMPLNN